MLKSLKPFMMPNLGGYYDCLDYCFFKVTVFNRRYEQLSLKKLFYIQYSMIALFRTCLLQARRKWFSYILYQLFFFFFLASRKRHLVNLHDVGCFLPKIVLKCFASS